MFRETEKKFGKIDVVIANAGLADKADVQEADEEDFDSMTDTNYRGLYFTVRYGLDHMNDGGCVLLISSIAAHITTKHHSIYQ